MATMTSGQLHSPRLQIIDIEERNRFFGFFELLGNEQSLFSFPWKPLAFYRVYQEFRLNLGQSSTMINQKQSRA